MIYLTGRGCVSWPRSRPRCGGWPRWWPAESTRFEIFSAVAEEAGRLLQVGQTNMIRYESDLREIARGIHPAIFSEGGLGPALRTLARRAAIAVERVPASR